MSIGGIHLYREPADMTTEPVALGANPALVVPRGTRRAGVAGLDGVRHLSLHAARGPVTIGSGGSRRQRG